MSPRARRLAATMITNELIAELRAKALSATPGPWEWDAENYLLGGEEKPMAWVDSEGKAKSGRFGILRTEPVYRPTGEDRDFIEALDPTTVLALLDEITRLRTEMSYATGRHHERTDAVDFIESPPGYVPERVRSSLSELVVALRSGQHEGWGKRLYEKDDADLNGGLPR